MSRVLVNTVVGPGPRRLSAAPRDRSDPIVRELLERARAEGYEEGLQAGRTRGAAEARDTARTQAEQLVASLSAALEEIRQEARVTREETVTEATELALAVAEVVLGREPHDGGEAICAQVREVLTQLEDPAPVVRVSAADTELLTAALADRRTVTVEMDPTLQPGEARIDGGWARADLTTDAAIAAVRRELHVDR